MQKKIVERETESFVCEAEKEHKIAQGIHCNVDGANDGESHYDETYVDDDNKVRCALVKPTTTDEFGEVEFVNEHMHALITDQRVNETYVDVNFDEHNLTSDEWLHMMQQNECIDILLFGEGSPLVTRSQVEENLFATTEACE